MKPTFEKYTTQGGMPQLKRCTHIRQLDKSDLYSFRLVSPTGGVILQSEGYSTIEHRDKAIAAVKVFAGFEDNYDRYQTSEGKWFFSLRTGSMGIVAASTPYDTPEELEAGINEVRSLAECAVIEETDYK